MTRKPHWEMTAKELAEATKQFDQPFVVDQSCGLTSSDRQKWDKVRSQRGRPRTGKGFKRVSVSLEQGLLMRVTALAKKRRISRSWLIARALERVLASEE